MEAKQISVRKGEIITKDGDFELFMYDLQFGRCAHYADYGSEDEVLIGTIEAPSFIGELGFLESMPRYGTVVALEDCILVRIDHENFSEYFTHRPQKIMQILEMMAGKNRNLMKRYADACNTIEEYLESEDKSGGILERMRRFASSRFFR